MGIGPVHWHEGLFLQPHHLQVMQRHLMEQFGQERSIGWPFPCGLVEERLSTDHLENHRLKYDRLWAVMPSGQVVNVPDQAELPPKSIKQAFEASPTGLTVYLGVPLYEDHRANVVEAGAGAQAHRTWRVQELQVADENTGTNPQPVPVRQVNAQLLLEGEDLAGFETLPLARIVRGTGEAVGLPRRDPHFIPPCLRVSGSRRLVELVQELASQVAASRQQLAGELGRAGLNLQTLRGPQVEQVLRLQTLSRYAGRLLSLAAVPAVAPFDVYLELRSLLGELAALRPDVQADEVAPYNHQQPAIAFGELNNAIRGLLRGIQTGRVLKVGFAMDEQAQALLATLGEEHLSGPSDYFLAVRSRQDSRAIIQLVEDMDRFKLMPRSLASSRARGIRLVEERQVPLEFPTDTGLHYFRLHRTDSPVMWERIGQEKCMAIRCVGIESMGMTCTLYMALPGEGE